MYLNDEDTWAEKEFGGLRTSLHRKKNRTIAEFQCFSACFMIKVPKCKIYLNFLTYLTIYPVYFLILVCPDFMFEN